jgi:RNA polymerase sigma-70 factor (ECF subfamily)
MGAMHEPSDESLIERSEDAPTLFEHVFERHFAPVLRYLRRRVGDDVADDLAAEVFTRAFAARSRYEPRMETALPWLLGIATNLVRMHRRAEQRALAAIARLSALPVIDDALRDPADDRIASAIATLPDDQRDVLLLYAWADLSHDQIAHALGIAEGTSRAYLSRARASLAHVLPPDLMEEQS